MFLNKTRILSGIQFTTHFIEFLVVETRRFVGSNVNVILMQQTCGQRSSMAAESKRRALGNHFPEKIWNMFYVSKYRGDWDLGLCTTSALALEGQMSDGKIWQKRVATQEKLDFITSVLQAQVLKLCTELDLSLIYILILGTYSKFTRKNNFPALGVCFPQPCCVKITFEKLPTNRFVSTTKNSMKSVVNWIPLRIRVRSRNTIMDDH